MVDVVFRDVTEDVARRSNRSTGVGHEIAPPQTSWPAEASCSHSQSTTFHPGRDLQGLPQTCSTPVEERAVCYFLSNYALTPHQASISRGYLEHLLPLYSSSPPDSALHATVSAVSMVAFANRFNAQLLLSQARRTYVNALALVNAALRDPEDVKMDATLMSVLLFSLYEVCQRSVGITLTFIDS
jgi:hypothetical protein